MSKSGPAVVRKPKRPGTGGGVSAGLTRLPNGNGPSDEADERIPGINAPRRSAASSGISRAGSATSRGSSDLTAPVKGEGAPMDLVTEFLAAVMAKDYKTAAPLCDEILRLDPRNSTVLQFRPLLAEKIELDAAAEADEHGGDDDGEASLSDEGVGGGEDKENDSEESDDGEEAELEVPDHYKASGIALRTPADVSALKRTIVEHAERKR